MEVAIILWQYSMDLKATRVIQLFPTMEKNHKLLFEECSAVGSNVIWHCIMKKLGRRPCSLFNCCLEGGAFIGPEHYLQARSRLLLAENQIIMRCLQYILCGRLRGIMFIFKFKGPRGEAVVIGMEIVEIFHLGKD